MTALPASVYRPGGVGAGAFNRPIPPSELTDPASSKVVDRLCASMGRERAFLSDGASLYASAPSDPLWALVCPQAGFPDRAPFRFRAPAGIRPGTPDADRPLVVYDPSLTTRPGELPAVRAWRATVDAAARIVRCEGMGLFDAGPCSDGLPVAGWGTGCGLSSDVGLITGEDVHSGTIRHALRLVAPPECHGTRWRLPARKSDQSGPGPIEMGMRLRLDPALTDGELQARTVPGDDPKCRRLLRMICRALRDYGAIVVDGVAEPDLYGLLMESEVSVAGRYPGGWRALAGTPAGGYWGNVVRNAFADATGDRTRRASDGVPWGRLQVTRNSIYA